jgi:hypothetical protein
MEQSSFGMASTLEVLHRTWHVETRSVRPDHRMVGHTGFLTTARLLVPFVDDRPTGAGPDAELEGDAAGQDRDADSEPVVDPGS